MTSPTPEQLARYADGFNESLTLKAFGAKLSFPDSKTVEVRLDPIRAEHRGGMGTEAVNGGILSAMFDLVIGCTPALLDPRRKSATVQLSLQFHAPVKGTRLVGRARIVRAGETLVFSEAEILDDQNQVCATATGMSRRSKEHWERGDTPAIN